MYLKRKFCAACFSACVSIHTHVHSHFHSLTHSLTHTLTHTSLMHTHIWFTCTYNNTHNTIASEPKITDFQPEVHATAGEQVTLRVNFTGIPKPTITWMFNSTKMEGDYATELGTDGSLLFVCVETKHAGRYKSSLYCIRINI